MNERIKQLAEQVRKARDPNSYQISESGVTVFFNGELEKFAELIVMECADWVKSRTMSNELKEGLKQHFGVK